jgi:hypothetical protein
MDLSFDESVAMRGAHESATPPSTVVAAARDASGIPGRLRPVKRLAYRIVAKQSVVTAAALHCWTQPSTTLYPAN